MKVRVETVNEVTNNVSSTRLIVNSHPPPRRLGRDPTHGGREGGLGETAARTIIEAHGGHFVAERTQMTIRLPLAPPPVQDEEPAAAAPRLVARQPS